MVHLAYLRDRCCRLKLVPYDIDDFDPYYVPGMIKMGWVLTPHSGQARLGKGIERKFYFRTLNGAYIPIVGRGKNKVSASDSEEGRVIEMNVSRNELEMILAEINS